VYHRYAACEPARLLRRRLLALAAAFFSARAAGTPLASAESGDAQTLAGTGLTMATALIDTILPADDSPGAVELGAPAFVDLVLRVLWTPAQHRDFLDGLNELAAALKVEAGASFESLPPTHRAGALARFDAETYLALADGQTATASQRAYLQLKEMTIHAYFTTEQIATRLLDYQPVPGEYQPDLPVTDATRTFYEDNALVGWLPWERQSAAEMLP
jgi:hypothetical protein